MEHYPLEEFSYDAEDTKLIEIFNQWLKNSKSYHDVLDKHQKVAEQYYLGNQTDRDEVSAHNSNVVENRIFEAVETIVPIVTANAHHFIVTPPTEAPSSKTRAEKTQKILAKKYQTLEIQRKLEDVVRNMLIFRFGVLKYCWDFEKNDIDVKVIDPRLILIPKMRLDPHDLPYTIEIQDYSMEELEEEFPDIDFEKVSLQRSQSDGNTKDNESTEDTYRVYETWTNETVAWISGSAVLKKKQNPYFDNEGEEKSVLDRAAKELRIKKQTVFHNHFDSPEKPFIFFTTFKVKLNEPIGSLSLVDVAIPLQDAINTQKRRIIDNLNRMGNGQVYVDSDAMSEEQSDNITDEIGLIIRGEGVASQNKVKREPGVPLPAGHFSNLQHSEMVFDNIMGVHGSTRGDAKSGTLGQDLLSRQQDFTRIDLITRVLNRGVARLANGLVQLMKLYYTELQTVKILGEDGATEFLQFNRNDVEDAIEIDVKSGQSLPMDEVSLRTEAVQLWQLGALDPVTLFERLKFPNAEKAAERLAAWKAGQLTQETQAKLIEINAGAQARAQIGASKTPAAPERKTETPMNVMQRAQANLGGGAPSLPQAPKL